MSPGVTGYDQAANKKQLMDHFKGFSKGVLRMLDMAPEDGVMVWELMDMELQPSLIKSRAVLIGDAAHPFLPCKSFLISHNIRTFVTQLLTCCP